MKEKSPVVAGGNNMNRIEEIINLNIQMGRGINLYKFMDDKE